MEPLDFEAVRLAAFPIEQSHKAIESVARAMGVRVDASRIGHSPGEPTSVGQVAALLEMDADLLLVSPAQVESLLRQACPGMVMIREGGAYYLLSIIDVRRDRVSILTPGSTVVTYPVQEFCDLLTAGRAAPYVRAIDELLSTTTLRATRRQKVRRILTRETLSGGGVRLVGWRLRPAAERPFFSQLQLYGIPRQVVALLGCTAAQYLCLTLGGLQLARGALAGRVDLGWLLAWGVLLITAIPFQVGGTWLSTAIVLETARLLKRRLFVGAMRADPDATRREGFGHFIGRVVQASALENVGINGGIQALLAIGTLLVSFPVLLFGARGGVLVFLLALVCGGLVFITRTYVERHKDWTDSKIEITNSLIEKMLGHRTRLAQMPRERQHVGEDSELSSYLEVAARLDRLIARSLAILPGLWLAISLAMVLPTALRPTFDPTPLAISLAGILVAQSGLQELVRGINALVGSYVSWRRVEPTFRSAAATNNLTGGAGFSLLSNEAQSESSGIVARHVRFDYGVGRPALDGISIAIETGERVLLEGPSGGGKSTLGAVIAGVRRPSNGMLLVNGLDLPSLGLHRWRRRVVLVPQFHDNHIFGASLEFNLLLGRAWPPTEDDRREAEQVCRELGLGEVIDRMPNGVMQLVGETGWQLSQGERSRVFVARALLQRSDIIILDESLGPLDPQTHDRVLECVARRAKTLILIAHP